MKEAVADGPRLSLMPVIIFYGMYSYTPETWLHYVINKVEKQQALKFEKN